MPRRTVDDGLTARERYEISERGQQKRARWRKKRASKRKLAANARRYRLRKKAAG